MGCSSSKASASLQKGPSRPKYRVAIVERSGHIANDSSKERNGLRYDSIPIANGCMNAGMSCEFLEYHADDHDSFVAAAMNYDGLIIRFPLGALDMGAQKRFDKLMDNIAIKGKAIWSTPVLQQRMSSKDALVKIKDLTCGLPDSFAYYDKEEFDAGFKMSCAFSPRIISMNRMGKKSGEGVWMVWLESKRYCETFGEKVLTDRDRLKLMEMNDNHVEHHTVKEFVEFCTAGPGGDAGAMWASESGGKYLEGGEARSSMYESNKGRIIDQRLLPHTGKEVVELQMVTNEVFQIVHKKQVYSGGKAECTYYKPNEPKFSSIKETFEKELGSVMQALGCGGEPLPLFWTVDFGHVEDHDVPFVVSGFNCSCVGLEQFGAAAGSDLTRVSKKDLDSGYLVANAMGRKAVEQLNTIKHGGGFTSVGQKPAPPPTKTAFKPGPKLERSNSDLAREMTPLPVRG